MMRLYMTFLSASAGGGLTYLRNVLPRLAGVADVHTTALLPPPLAPEFGGSARVEVVPATGIEGRGLGRFVREQRALPGLLERARADVLVSTGNMALLGSPIPQIVLARNALYTSRQFRRDLVRRRAFGLLADTVAKTWLARRAVRVADATVAPSEAFAAALRRWVPERASTVLAIPHGFDHAAFFDEAASLPAATAARLARDESELRLLFVSHYNYFRNFETLLRALPLLKSRVGGRRVKLVLTCELRPKPAWGPYDATAVRDLVRRLGVRDDLVELDLVPYRGLHHVYRACDVYVTPSYVESFGHPLVEAMASGLPVVASDLAVHREVCGDAAVYFPALSADALARRIADVACSPDLATRLARRGRARSGDFSWDRHVVSLVSLGERLARRGPSRGPATMPDRAVAGRATAEP